MMIGRLSPFAILVMLTAAPTPARSEASWIDEACPAALGDSLRAGCTERQRRAIERPAWPALDGLPPDRRAWVERACPRRLGPELWRSCAERQLNALDAPGWPDRDGLTPTERSELDQRCSPETSPDFWRPCAERELARIVGARTPPASAAAAAAAPPSNAPDLPATAPSANAAPARPASPAAAPPARSQTAPAPKPATVAAAAPPRPAATAPAPPTAGEPVSLAARRLPDGRPGMPDQVARKALTPPELHQRLAPSIYLVVAARNLAELRRQNASIGSAVGVSSNQALTNCHVIEKRSIIGLLDGDKVLIATPGHGDPKSDRCFLDVKEGGLRPIAGVRRHGELVVGERVFTIGNPSGLTKTLGEGIISGLRTDEGQRMVQVTAPISPGSSGGALLDAYGNLIGITTYLLRGGQSLNFAIAAEEFWR